MKRTFFSLIFLLVTKIIFAENEIGPEGNKLGWFFVVTIVVVLSLIYFFSKKSKGKSGKSKRSPFKIKKVAVKLEKDALYYPDNLELTVINKGSADIDLDRPLLVFDNFWLKRKFRLKGMGNYNFYPLYLERGKTHTLEININRFYSHDKKLKRFPKARVIIYDVKGKRLGSKSVFLRKTLFKF